VQSKVFHKKFNVRGLKANLRNSKKYRTRVMQKFFRLCFYLLFLQLKPNFKYSSLSFFI